MLDRYIKKWTAEKGITNFQVGKKQVKCELFLDVGLFEEYTCTAKASVCWGEDQANAAAGSGTTDTAAADSTTANNAVANDDDDFEFPPPPLPTNGLRPPKPLLQRQNGQLRPPKRLRLLPRLRPQRPLPPARQAWAGQSSLRSNKAD